MKPLFDENGLATQPGEIRAYYFDPNTNEFKGWSDEYINTGVSMPGNSTDIDPGEYVEGEVAVFVLTGWEKKEDHRGKVVYSTSNRAASVVDYIGKLKEGYVSIEPETPFDIWDGTSWVYDAVAEHAQQVAAATQQKSILMAEASNVIAPLLDAKDGGYIEDSDIPVLQAWQKYRYSLTKVDTALAPNISWPVAPTS